MGYIPNFDYDIFLSYARNDDQEEWVAKFLKSLQIKLKQRLGIADDLLVYFDRKALKSNDDLETLKQAARQSAVFLAICSPSYASRTWTRAELEAFVTANNYGGRVFGAELLPLDPGKQYPEPLESQHRMPFWRKGGHYSDTARAIRPDDPDFGDLTDELAVQIKRKLVEMRDAPARAAGPAVTESELSRYRPVLLAQAHGDTPNERLTELRKYLAGAGVPVTRKGGFPQGAQEFRAELAKDLERAGLVVHLLGKHPSHAPDDDSPSYTQIQEAAARAHGVEILRWYSPEITGIDEMTDLRQRELLKSAATGSFEDFKAAVVKAAEKPIVREAAAVDVQAPRKPFIFVDAHMNDKDLARQACRAFDTERFVARPPFWQYEDADFRKSMKENVEKCDALVVMYGKVTPDYVLKRCEEYVTTRLWNQGAEKARIVAVIYAPPDEKEPVDLYTSELEHYVITGEGEPPDGMRPDKVRGIYAYPDLHTAIERVMEKLAG